MSRETDSLIAFVKARVPGAVVTATVGHFLSPQDPCSPHSPTSIHCAQATGGRGRAVDWGGDEASRTAVFNALAPQAGHLAELIHNGSGITAAVKNGKWANGLAVYGSTTWNQHQNHTHSAVPFGVFLAELAPAAPPAAVVLAPPPLVLAPPREVTGVKITAGNIPVAALDDGGHGYVSIPAPIDRVLFVAAQGSAPARDKTYWPPVAWDLNDSGAETVVTIYGQPHQSTVIYYKVLEEV